MDGRGPVGSLGTQDTLPIGKRGPSVSVPLSSVGLASLGVREFRAPLLWLLLAILRSIGGSQRCGCLETSPEPPNRRSGHRPL